VKAESLARILHAARLRSITTGELHALSLLSSSPDGELTIAAIADGMNVTAIRIQSVADSMEDVALASRYLHPRDRNTTMLRITAAGRQALDTILACGTSPQPVRPVIGLRLSRG
jgi:DNA-binding MarR family transcriptional regulator